MAGQVVGSLMIEMAADVARVKSDMAQVKSLVGNSMNAVRDSNKRAEAAFKATQDEAKKMLGLSRDFEQFRDAVGQAEQRTNHLTGSMSGLKTMVAAVGVTGLARQYLTLSDTYAGLQGRLKLVTSGSTELSTVQEQLFGVAQRSRSSFSETADLYARVARSSQSLGLESNQLLGITETISKAMIVSGGSADSMRAALVQLGQGFASGVLRGEELNSVMEQQPRLAQAIADGLGVTIGQLRKLGEEGKLTSGVVIQALASQREAIEREFGQMPKTVSQAFTAARNELLKFVGEADQARGVSAGLAEVIVKVSQNLDVVAAAAAGVASMKLAQWAGQTAVAFGQQAAAMLEAGNAAQMSNRAMLAHAVAEQAVLQARVASTAATVASTQAELRLTETQVAQGLVSGGFLVSAKTKATAATLAEKTAVDQLAAAQARLTALQGATSAGATIAARALGLLGGPIGAVSLALGLGGTAWQLWGSSTQRHAETAAGAVRKETSEIVAAINDQIAKLRERNALMGSGALTLAGGNEDAARRVTEIKGQMADVATGRGNYGNLPQVARDDMLQKLGLQLASVINATRELERVQAAASAKTKENLDAKWLGQFPTELERINVKLAEARKEYEAIGATMPREVEARIRSSMTKGMAAAVNDGIGAQIEAMKSGYALEQQLTEAHVEYLGHQRRMGSLSEIEYIEQTAEAEVRQLQLSRQAVEEQIMLLGAKKNSESEVAKLNAERLRLGLQIDAVETKAGNAVVELLKKRKDLIGETIALQKKEDAEAWAQRDRERLDTWNRALQSVNDYATGLRESTELAEFELSLQGQGEQARRTGLAQHQIELELRKQILAIQQSGLDAEQQRLLVEKARAAAAAASAGVPARVAADEWQRASESIERSLTDALMRGFEGGKGVVENFVDTTKNMFATLILRPRIEALVKYGVSGASSLIGMANPASALAADQGFNPLSAAGNVASLGSAFTFGSMGSNFVAGLGATFNGVGIGTSLGAASAGVSAGATGASVAYGLGAVAPYIAAIIAIYSLMSKGGETRTGGQYGMRDGKVSWLEGPSGGDPNAVSTIRAIETAQQQIYSLVGTLGGSGGGTITRAGYENSKYHDKRFSEIFVNDAGRRYYGETSDFSNEAVAEFFATDLQRAVILGIQSAELDRHFAEYFAQINPFELNAEQLANVVGVATAIKQMTDSVAIAGGVFLKFGDTSVEMRQRVIELTGGMESFNQKFSSYIGNYYSDTEQAQISAAQIQAAMRDAGIFGDWLGNKDQFRWLMDSLDPNSEVGSKQVATLLNYESQFAQLTEFMNANKVTLGDLASQVPDSIAAAIERTTANQVNALQQQAQANDVFSGTVNEFGQYVNSMGESARRMEAAADLMERMAQAQYSGTDVAA